MATAEARWLLSLTDDATSLEQSHIYMMGQKINMVAFVFEDGSKLTVVVDEIELEKWHKALSEAA